MANSPLSIAWVQLRADGAQLAGDVRQHSAAAGKAAGENVKAGLVQGVRDGGKAAEAEAAPAGARAANGFRNGLKPGLAKTADDGRAAGTAHGKAFGEGATSKVKEEQGKFRETIGEGFKASLAGLSAGLIGLGAVEVFSHFIEGAAEARKASALTAQVIKTTGGAAHVTAEDVDNLARSISDKTGIDDDQVHSSENLLLTFTNVRNELGKGNDVFNQATGLVQDMSVALGQDAKSSAIQLGKALNDPIKGVTALQRVGVSFTQSQRDQIKVLVQSGNTLAAQKIILGEVGREFGGAAEAAATPLQKLQVRIDNLGKAAAGALLPIIDKIATVLTDTVIPAFETTGSALGKIPGPVYKAAAGLGLLYGAIRIGTATTLLFDRVATGAALKMFSLASSVAAAAGAETAEAGAATVATGATGRMGVAATLAGNAFGTMAGKLVLGAGIAGIALAASKVSELFAHTETAKVGAEELGKALTSLGGDAAAPTAAINAVTTASDRWFNKVKTGNDVVNQFAGLAKGAFGDGLQDVIGRMQSMGERTTRFNDSAAQMDAALARMVKGGNLAGAADFLDRVRKASGLSDVEFQHVTNHLPAYTSALKASAVAQRLSATAGEAAVVSGQKWNLAYANSTYIAQQHATKIQLDKDKVAAHKAATDLDAAASKAAADALQGWLTKLQTQQNRFLGLRGAQNQYKQSLDDATSALKENGRTLDVNSAKGRANRSALDAVATAELGVTAKMVENGQKSPAIRAEWERQRTKLYDVARQFGLNKSAANDYVDHALGRVPPSVSTNILTPGMLKAKQDLARLQTQILSLQGKSLEIVIDSHGNALLRDFTHAGKAEGGRISGPGGPKDDKAGLFRLSDGEFVVNASAASRHLQLLEAINGDRVPGMRAGGVVRNINLNTKDHMPQASWVSNLLRQIDPLAVMGLGGGGGGASGPAGGAARWAGVILQALRLLGQPSSWLGTVESRMNRESGGNPTIVNRWDSNWLAGTPSVGGMQVIGPTFAAYAGPFRNTGPFEYGVSTNMLANTYAGLNYALHRYGTLAALNRPGGYDTGGLARGAGLIPKPTNAPERVLSPRQTEAFEAAMNRGFAGSAPPVVHVYIGDEEITSRVRVVVDDAFDTFGRRLDYGYGTVG